MKRPRILLAEDHTLVAEALQKLLEPQYEIVGIVSDGRALLATAQELKPDLAFVDIGMPLLNGLDAARQLRELMPHLKIIFLTMNEDPNIASAALALGASGYLFKTSAGAELLKAVQQVLRGQPYVTPRISEQMQAAFIRDPNPKRRDKHLTMRQREVVQLLAEGRAMKEAADILGVTPRTIAFHKYRTMEEFGIRNNAELVRFAIREGMLRAS